MSFPRVCIKSKLRNGQEFSPHIQETEVHLTVCVGKDPQVRDLVRQLLGISRSVPVCNS